MSGFVVTISAALVLTWLFLGMLIEPGLSTVFDWSKTNRHVTSWLTDPNMWNLSISYRKENQKKTC